MNRFRKQDVKHETNIQAAAVLETISEGFQAFDRQWRYIYLNGQAERILGRKREELLGKVCWEEYPEAVGTPFHQHYLDAMETGEIRVFEDFCPHRKNWIEISLHPSPEGLVAYSRDITERKQAEALIIGQNRILESIAGGAPLTEVLESTICLVEEQAPGAVGAIQLEAEGTRQDRGAAVAGKEPVDGSDVTEDPSGVRSRHLPLDGGPRFCWSTPIVSSDKSPLGTFDVYYPQPHEPSRREQQVVDVAVHIARIAIERDRVEARRRAFLGEMLSSLTEGRLRLCGAARDLPEPLPHASKPVQVSPPTLRVLRKIVEVMAEGTGLPTARFHDFVTGVSEAAMNAVVHAGGGQAQVYADPDTGRVQVWVRDQGTGIAEESLHRATLERGYSSAGTLGHGFWIMLKTCDRLWLLTGAGGTTIVLEQERTAPEPAWLHDVRIKAAANPR